jgi:hypothetical protein
MQPKFGSAKKKNKAKKAKVTIGYFRGVGDN